mgnify:CR=1 FL=1|tara:strand:+ start:580 stop:840 length:261 start_codon:yes stop_codon:yes gene_type:complete
MCVSIQISTNPNLYDCNCIDGEFYDDDEVIIVFEEMKNTIQQIEANLTNGIDVSSIFVFIDKDNEDKDDIFDLLISIYSRINFIID